MVHESRPRLGCTKQIEHSNTSWAHFWKCDSRQGQVISAETVLRLKIQRDEPEATGLRRTFTARAGALKSASPDSHIGITKAVNVVNVQ